MSAKGYKFMMMMMIKNREETKDKPGSPPVWIAVFLVWNLKEGDRRREVEREREKGSSLLFHTLV